MTGLGRFRPPTRAASRSRTDVALHDLSAIHVDISQGPAAAVTRNALDPDLASTIQGLLQSRLRFWPTGLPYLGRVHPAQPDALLAAL